MADLILFLLGAIVAAALYFLPFAIAHFRGHPQENTIGILNAFFGWTVIGWIGLLAWSVSGFSE